MKTLQYCKDRAAFAIKAAAALVLLIVLAACPTSGGDDDSGNTTPTSTPVAVTGVTLDASAVTLYAGASRKLAASVAPSDAANKAVSWTSSNAAAASVGTDGTVSALASGTATITVTTADGGHQAACAVTVVVPGQLDVGFNAVGMWAAGVELEESGFYAMLPLPGGKVLGVGYCYDGSNYKGLLVRFNADGSPDAGFGSGGKVLENDTEYKNATVAADGSIYAAGQIGSSHIGVVKYTPSGTVDASFASAGKFDAGYPGCANAVGLDSSGRIILGGWGDRDSLRVDMVFRLSSAGILDTTFGTAGMASYAHPKAINFSEISGMIVDGQGRIVGAGRVNSRPFIVRFTSEGQLDTSFGEVDGPVRTGMTQDDMLTGITYGSACGLAQAQDGSYVIGGASSTDINLSSDSTALVLAVDGTGTPVSSFGSGGAASFPALGQAYVFAIAADGDGKIYLAGRTYGSGSETYNSAGFILKTGSSGALDTAFGDGGTILFIQPLEAEPQTSSSDEIYGLSLDSSGRILAGGYSVALKTSGTNTAFAARLWK